ncbi:conserved hypothetical protein [Culex quinquefasciatus]|uniref:G-patch domain-containing protein n=1 Tax=Culex quinquefasciatus TaxID=7176 RepID=B0WCX2_CULQU|nr:conserved hypothetical protein [Culex quinquefasciatus]|eukprot:XP_001846556.1 conserved hypothetical protein [Culex quinquefasciatus]
MVHRESVHSEDRDILLICEPVSLDCDSNVDLTSKGEPLSVVPDEEDANLEQYRNPFEPDLHWELRRKFLEQHRNKLTEDELVSLSQAFVNVEIWGAVYCEEMMARVALLGGTLAEEFRNRKRQMTQRISVPASQAAIDWVHQVSEGQRRAERRLQAAEMLHPVFPVTIVADVFRNFVLVEDNLEDSKLHYEALNGGGFVYDVRATADPKQFEATITASGLRLSRVVGTVRKAKQRCREEVLRLVRQKCYKIKTNPNRCWYSCNVERLPSEQNVDCDGNPFASRWQAPPKPFQSKDQLKEDNVGYRMLKKLGWGGGPLGKHKIGIVDPIEVQAKRGRRGLGLPQPTPAPSILSLSEASNFPLALNYHQPTPVLDLGTIPFQIDVNFYKDLIRNFKARQIGYDLIFSPEFTDLERTLLFKLASEQNVTAGTVSYDYEHYQFMLPRHRVPPHELLVKILVEKHPVYCSLYTVEPPEVGEDGRERHNKVLELCSR